jgi:hypothetical protein
MHKMKRSARMRWPREGGLAMLQGGFSGKSGVE